MCTKRQLGYRGDYWVSSPSGNCWADTYNLRLSARRAESVKAWLVQQGGIDGKRMTTKGWGEAKPVAPNTHPDGSDNPEGRQRNRRVELTVKK